MSIDKEHSFVSKKEKIPEETENLIKEAEHVLQNNKIENLSELKKSTLELSGVPEEETLILTELVQKKKVETPNLSELKKSTLKLSEISKKESLILTELVQEKEAEIENLKDKEILLERNKIQADIQKKQELIIDEYKSNNDKFKLDLDELQTKIVELNKSNRRFLTNNEELIKTISRYIQHNKNLQSSLNELKEIQSEHSKSKLQISKMVEQIKFYQDDNSRLSSEVLNIQKKYDTIKNNFDVADKEKNDIFKKIKGLNNSISANNVVGTPFVKEIILEESINSKILNDITKTNLEKEKTNPKSSNELDDLISDIFK